MKSLFLLFTFFLFSVSSSFAQSRQSLGADNLKIGTAGSAFDSTIELAGTSVKIKGNKTTGKAQFTNDGSVWKNLGAGSGSGAAGQTFNLNGSIEDGFAVNHSYTGSVATEVTGTGALEGDKSVVLDFTALNDYYRSDYFTVPKGLYGSSCELRFKYLGGDANIYVKVENEVGTVVGQYQRPESGSIAYGLQAITSPGYESVYFKCPTQADITANSLNGKIRYVVYQGTASNAPAITMDLFSQGELTGLVEVTSPDSLSSKVSSTDAVTDENINFINGDCTDADLGEATCSFNAGYFTVAPNCTAVGSNGSLAIMDILSTSASSVTIKGISRADATTYINSSFVLNCEKQGVDAKQSVQVYKSIPKVAQNTNVFSAYLNAAGTVISNSNVPFISSCVATSTANTCDFIVGVFTVAPNCSYSRTSIGESTVNTSTTQLAINYANSAGSGGSKVDGQIICTKQGVDFQLPTVQPIVIGQVTSSASETGLVNVRTESCLINNSGTATVDTGSGLCSGWVSSVSRTAAGAVTINVIVGIFSSSPVCQATASGISNGWSTRMAATPTTTVITTISELATTSVDTDTIFTLTCTGKR
jgi:hypothetical protein